MVVHERVGHVADVGARAAHAPAEQRVLTEAESARSPVYAEAEPARRFLIESGGGVEDRPPVEDVACREQPFLPGSDAAFER